MHEGIGAVIMGAFTSHLTSRRYVKASNALALGFDGADSYEEETSQQGSSGDNSDKDGLIAHIFIFNLLKGVKYDVREVFSLVNNAARG